MKGGPPPSRRQRLRVILLFPNMRSASSSGMRSKSAGVSGIVRSGDRLLSRTITNRSRVRRTVEVRLAPLLFWMLGHHAGHGYPWIFAPRQKVVDLIDPHTLRVRFGYDPLDLRHCAV